jgi:hypothetical protein
MLTTAEYFIRSYFSYFADHSVREAQEMDFVRMLKQ